MILLLTNTPLKALSYSLFSSRQISLSRMQQLINQLLDLQLFCPHLSNIKRIAYRLFTKTIQQFDQHLKAENLDRQTLQLIVLRLQNDFALLRYLLFSPVETISNKDIAVKNSPTSPLFNPKPSPALTLTLLYLLSHIPALVYLNFVVLTRWALWGHPERKQTILQTPISSPHPTRRKLLQLRCRTSYQEFANWKICLPMKYQLTHPSLRGSIPNIFSYTIKVASLNLAIHMLLFGKFSQ